MNNKNIAVSILIIAVAIGLGYYVMHRKVEAPSGTDDKSQTTVQNKTFNLACDAGKSLAITFHVPTDDAVDVTLSDGRTMSLPNSSSGTVISYTSADKNTVLTVSGASVSVVEAKKTTYSNCISPADTTGAATQ